MPELAAKHASCSRDSWINIRKGKPLSTNPTAFGRFFVSGAAMLPSVAVKQVVIVSFDQDVSNAKLLTDLGHPAPRVISYAVTLDPARLSPAGDFIRFGQWGDGGGAGDEITGWIHLDDLTIEEVLATWDGEAFRPFVVQSAERAA